MAADAPPRTNPYHAAEPQEPAAPWHRPTVFTAVHPAAQASLSSHVTELVVGLLRIEASRGLVDAYIAQPDVQERLAAFFGDPGARAPPLGPLVSSAGRRGAQAMPAQACGSWSSPAPRRRTRLRRSQRRSAAGPRRARRRARAASGPRPLRPRRSSPAPRARATARRGRARRAGRGARFSCSAGSTRWARAGAATCWCCSSAARWSTRSGRTPASRSPRPAACPRSRPSARCSRTWCCRSARRRRGTAGGTARTASSGRSSARSRSSARCWTTASPPTATASAASPSPPAWCTLASQAAARRRRRGSRRPSTRRTVRSRCCCSLTRWPRPGYAPRTPPPPPPPFRARLLLVPALLLLEVRIASAPCCWPSLCPTRW